MCLSNFINKCFSVKIKIPGVKPPLEKDCVDKFRLQTMKDIRPEKNRNKLF